MKTRQAAFKPFQLNRQLLGHAEGKCKILHCLPARRGEEITDEVIDGESGSGRTSRQSYHLPKGLLIWLALQHQQLSADDLKREGIDL